MALRPRIYYNAEQKAQMWDRWQKGESLTGIGRIFDRPSSSIFNQLSPSGGIRPPPRRRSRIALTLPEREEISRGIVCDLSVRAIASQLERSPSTVSREISRNGGLKCYRASQADQAAWDRAHRGEKAQMPLVTRANRWLVEKRKPDRRAPYRVTRNHLSKPVYSSPGRAEEGIAAIPENSPSNPSIEACQPETERFRSDQEHGVHQ